MKTRYLILEFKNILGNFIGIFFGFIFPVLLANIIIFSRKSEIPPQFVSDFKVTIFITMISIIPLSLALVGFPALFSQETEKGVTRRMVLFGYGITKQLINKLISNIVVIFIAVGVYFFSVGYMNDIKLPSAYSLFILLVSLFIISIDFYMITFAITWWLKKFSYVYGVTMVLYFIVMILTGMFGVSSEKFGTIIYGIAKCIPITLFAKTLIKNWSASFYSLGNYVWVLIGFTIFSFLLFLLSKKTSRN